MTRFLSTLILPNTCRFTADSRLLYLTMGSLLAPLTALQGLKCAHAPGNRWLAGVGYGKLKEEEQEKEIDGGR